MKNIAVLMLSLLLAPVAFTQQQTFDVNAAASEVKMTLNTNHEVVHGTFHVQSGTIATDSVAHKMSGSVVASAGSGQTGNGSRDKRMNKEVLRVEQYATVTFEPKSYTGTLAPRGDSTLQVTGILTLIGNPHEITMPMQIHMDGSTATAKAHFLIPFVQWGLKDPSILFWKTDKNVAIDLALSGQLSQ